MWLLRILKVVAILTPIVPARVGYALCAIAGCLFCVFNSRARRDVVANLSHVMPEASWPLRHLTAARVCITVVTNYYDLIRLRSVDRDAILQLAEVDGLAHVERAMATGRGAIIVSGHIGNFSVMARLPAVLGYRAAIIAERVEPDSLYTYMAKLRSALGVEVIAPGSSSLRPIIKLLKNNGLLLLAADRDVKGGAETVELFGTRTKLPAGPVLLAMRTGASLIPAFTLRQSGNRSRVVIGGPVSLQRTSNWEADVRENTQRMAHRLEQMIFADPGQWAVLQRVWPPTSHYGRSEGLGSAADTMESGNSHRDQSRLGH